MRRLLFITLILFLSLAGWLRFYQLGAQSYWNDEGISLGLAGRDVPTVLSSAAADIHPPGYYLLLKVWHTLTGDSEFALRALSALSGLVLVALLYRLGRVYFDRLAAVAATFLGALNPFLVYYSQEARMYELAAALGAASFLLFSLWLRSSRPPGSPYGNRRLAIAYCLVTAAGLYTHYAFAFVVLAENLAALGGLMAHGRAPSVRPATLAPAAWPCGSACRPPHSSSSCPGCPPPCTSSLPGPPPPSTRPSSPPCPTWGAIWSSGAPSISRRPGRH